MKQNCQPPYEKCVHGHFYRAALEAGIEEEKAVKLTEQLKELHKLESFDALEKDISKILSNINKKISLFPAKIQDEAVRVLYAVLRNHRPPEASWLNETYREEEIFIYSLNEAIRKTYPQALQGVTYYHTYEMWLNGGYHKPPSTSPEIYNNSTRRWEKDIMPQEEYEKIITKREEIAQDHIQKNLNWYIERIENQLSKSEEKERLLNQEIEVLEKALFDKNFTSLKVWYAVGDKMTFSGSRHSSTSQQGWFNEIAYWVDAIKIRAIYEAYEFIQPNDDGNYNRKIIPINAVVLYEYKKYLKNRLAEIQGLVKPSQLYQQEISFENLFVSPDAMQTALELAQRAGLIAPGFQYCMGSKGKYAIAAYWHFLKDQPNNVFIRKEYRDSGQKACEAIANYFNTTIGKELYQQNQEAHGVLPHPSRGYTFYKKLVDLFGKRESFG